jgi:L-iditol 2-dehydrogenase
VVVLGVGPVGLVHVAKAALTGAAQVIGVDRFATRLRLAEELGATDTLIVEPGQDDAPARVRELGEVDVVVDATGHPASFGPALRMLRDGGTLLEVGAFVDLGTVPVNPADVLGRNLTIVGVAGEDARIYDATLQMLAEHHQQVPFHRAVTHRFPLDQARQAMETALAADDAMKVVIIPD